MAKDPAFLFYPGDWQGGTMYLTHEQKGCYMDLLILQFNAGKFTIDQAKQVLSICFPVAWPMLQQKFKTDGTFFWNERLQIEIEKRRNFTKSRRDNALHPKKHNKHKKHMLKHMENEDLNENINTNEVKNELVFPFDSQNFLKHWQIWKSYKKDQHRFTYKTPISEQAALNDLVNLAEGREDRAIEIIMQSISKSWKGFFELKINLNGKQQPGTLRAEVQADSERRRKEREQART